MLIEMFRSLIICLVAITYVLSAVKMQGRGGRQPVNNRFGQPGLVKFNDLGNGEIKTISVSGCTNRQSCNITNGQNYTVNVTFQANQDSATAYFISQVLLNGTLSPPIANIESDGCVGLSPQCPIRRRVTYTLSRVWSVTGTTFNTTPILLETLSGTSGILEYGAIRFTVV